MAHDRLASAIEVTDEMVRAASRTYHAADCTQDLDDLLPEMFRAMVRIEGLRGARTDTLEGSCKAVEP